ncbi:MAG: GNAT family N-acetyltransferase [Deltaproteobacteria bacterium]|nr:GNAT family N-acetyltransferase [Deltaproteobacteria bacterium]MBW2136218.1 GNAT family N-acetyltransferase [Deltaproteobacteria bacterium]
MEGTIMDEHPSEERGGIPGNLGINDRLGLISLIDEGIRLGNPESPIIADLFNDLWELVNATISGSKIDPLKPEDTRNGFRSFEITAPTGENLGHLNMLYFKKPIPCYYLVYVEVSAPFRRKGLGTRILEHFRTFLVDKNAIGILDNIIPENDPTYDIYLKQGWEPLESIVGDGVLDPDGNYMVYLPSKFQGKALKEPLVKLLHHLKRRRAAIDMRDNEVMVQRTITEFKNVYGALLAYFRSDIQWGKATPLMRFMFTRYVTKLIAFRRRIADLIGYTGGESMEQITLDPKVASMPIQSYAPYEAPEEPTLLFGDRGLWSNLPGDMKRHPAHFINSLPNYPRPSLLLWLKKKGRTPEDTLTLGDLMDLGFDPTRLKELNLAGQEFIIERVQPRLIERLKGHRDLLDELHSEVEGHRVRNALLKVNVPLLALRDRSNAYVLWRRIKGIHHDEALEMLQSVPSLKTLNDSLSLDRMIISTLRGAKDFVTDRIGPENGSGGGPMTYFVSWNLEKNRPSLIIDPLGGSFLESVWIS